MRIFFNPPQLLLSTPQIHLPSQLSSVFSTDMPNVLHTPFLSVARRKVSLPDLITTHRCQRTITTLPHRWVRTKLLNAEVQWTRNCFDPNHFGFSEMRLTSIEWRVQDQLESGHAVTVAIHNHHDRIDENSTIIPFRIHSICELHCVPGWTCFILAARCAWVIGSCHDAPCIAHDVQDTDTRDTIRETVPHRGWHWEERSIAIWGYFCTLCYRKAIPRYPNPKYISNAPIGLNLGSFGSLC